ncbi:DUF3796 domain-containing protein [Romboutsia lituseburensis]|uniref:DUF3796 domain-containing protein n=1 Tax=Romboutsia lituseburensis DSM 797 TaxID=1121325 RepID=A0A1G9I9M3_9FIRM|nr:DUF3796 domain-containing protein [Romboutsia lituseburensis]CEH33987.1 Protein of unknown function (DUF3796) [Romboutsia lituseburensis]SDL21960.1 Protein of unknown function [Romboutsia lituseburensis DSM 797]
MKGVNKYTIFFALFGFLGFKELNGDPLGLLYFGFFGNLSVYWWCKLGTYEDERLISNKQRAGCIAFYIGFLLAVVASVLIRLYTVDLLMLYRLQVLIVALTFAISMNLWAFLTYKFDTGN